MWRFTLFLLILAGFPGMVLPAQQPGGSDYPDLPLRIEIPARSVNETYRIIPCGTNGLIMFFRSQEVTEDARTKWYFTCYDTNLQQVWVKSVPLYGDLDYRFHQNGQDTLALLFVHAGKSKTTENKYQILRIVPLAGTLILNSGTMEHGASIDAFDVKAGRGWLGVNVRGKAGKIVNIGLKQGTIKTFLLGNGDQISLLWMQPDNSSVTVSAIVSRQVSKKNTEYYLVRYDTNGLIRREVLIGTQTVDHTLTQVRATTLPAGAELMLGSYGQGVTSPTQKNRPIDESTGLFTSTILNGTQKSISFYKFL